MSGPADPTAQIPSDPTVMNIPDIWKATGPMLLGHLFNYLLMGILAIQVYIYTLSFPRDQLHIKLLVWGVFFLDILQTGFASHFAWYVLAEGWGNPLILRFTPWTLATVPVLSGLVALLVQFFFAWRIWILGTGKKIYLPIIGLIVISAIGACVCAFYAGIYSGHLRDVAQAAKLNPEVTGWLATSVGCDFLITATLVYQLSSRKNEGFAHANHVIHRAIRLSVETGAITTAVVVCDLALFLLSEVNSWYFMFGLLIGKLYSNSLMASLNSRSNAFKSKSGGGSGPAASTNVQVWQSVDVTRATGGRGAGTLVSNNTTHDIEFDELKQPKNYDLEHGPQKGNYGWK